MKPKKITFILLAILTISCTSTTTIKNIKRDEDIKVCKSDPEYKYISEYFQRFQTTNCIVIHNDIFTKYRNSFFISKLANIPLRPTDETKKKFDLDVKSLNPDEMKIAELDFFLFDEIIRNFQYIYIKNNIGNSSELDINYNQKHNKQYQINYHWNDYIGENINLNFQLYSNIENKILSEKEITIPYKFKELITGDGPVIPKAELSDWLVSAIACIPH